ncbi:MAG: ImmA/IrrE family metallo-endopeptidase [Nigerium sp.]|nr:ImmA/IrrE family metallo-endopeptidase [Nigerium sp.]
MALEQALSDTALLVELGHVSLPARPGVLDRPGTVREAEALAAVARQWCELDDRSPATDLTNAVLIVGLLAFAEPMASFADAATASNGSWGVALINGTNHVGRRRLSLVHELGHYLFDDGYVEDFRIDAPEQDQHEARLDRFARAFLLPADAVSKRWNELHPTGLRQAAVLLASAFRVDMSTLARRLHTDLGLVDAPTADQIRKISTNQADIVENDLYFARAGWLGVLQFLAPGNTILIPDTVERRSGRHRPSVPCGPVRFSRPVGGASIRVRGVPGSCSSYQRTVASNSAAASGCSRWGSVMR